MTPSEQIAALQAQLDLVSNELTAAQDRYNAMKSAYEAGIQQLVTQADALLAKAKSLAA